MKILFFEPRGSYANVFEKSMGIPMLGPVYLATILRNEGFDVSVINENIMGREIQDTELAEADILCVSCMTATVERGKKVAHRYKEVRKSQAKSSRSIIGGIHASMLPEDVMDDFDQVFIGEAENHIVDLIQNDSKSKLIYGTPLKSLDQLPVPEFSVLKGHEKMKVIPIMTSRGCPYDCNFCSVTEMFGRGYRTRGIENVMKEVTRFPDKKIFFVDDHFVVNKKRTNEMLDKIMASNFQSSWSAQLRTEVSRDEKLVKKMQKAGCNMVYIGFESINPDSLKEMRKGQSVEDIQRSVQVFLQNGIFVHGMFMFGLDSDDKSVFKATSDFCNKSGITTVQYLILTPLPGTDLYRKLEKENRLLHKNWEYYDAMHVVFKPKNFTPKELQQGMIECFSDFYSYTRAINVALNTALEAPFVLFKSIRSKTKLPSLVPILIKIIGKKIVNSWVAYNRSYLHYLEEFKPGKR